ncbi:DUF134 domain-containing protein [Coprothermobacteraceae bacterium]|nr:DUF134 domain-containing protein [Coprothermobacteraceae bacterium]
MPRPRKCKRIGFKPLCAQFVPTGDAPFAESVITLEELEALRLCDYLGLDQEEAAAEMGVSRGTVQRLLASGRRKLVEALVDSRAIRIEGGSVEFVGPRGHRWHHGPKRPQ